MVPSPLPSSRPANLVVSPPGEDSTHVTLTGDALDISVLNPINVQPFEIPVTRGGDAAGYHVAIGQQQGFWIILPYLFGMVSDSKIYFCLGFISAFLICSDNFTFLIIDTIDPPIGR